MCTREMKWSAASKYCEFDAAHSKWVKQTTDCVCLCDAEAKQVRERERGGARMKIFRICSLILFVCHQYYYLIFAMEFQKRFQQIPNAHSYTSTICWIHAVMKRTHTYTFNNRFVTFPCLCVCDVWMCMVIMRFWLLQHESLFSPAFIVLS